MDGMGNVSAWLTFTEGSTQLVHFRLPKAMWQATQGRVRLRERIPPCQVASNS